MSRWLVERLISWGGETILHFNGELYLSRPALLACSGFIRSGSITAGQYLRNKGRTHLDAGTGYYSCSAIPDMLEEMGMLDARTSWNIAKPRILAALATATLPPLALPCAEPSEPSEPQDQYESYTNARLIVELRLRDLKIQELHRTLRRTRVGISMASSAASLRVIESSMTIAQRPCP